MTARTATEKFRVDIDETKLARAITVALLYVNGHHRGCARVGGADCPVGAELRDVGKRAAPLVMDELLDIGRLVR